MAETPRDAQASLRYWSSRMSDRKYKHLDKHAPLWRPGRAGAAAAWADRTLLQGGHASGEHVVAQQVTVAGGSPWAPRQTDTVIGSHRFATGDVRTISPDVAYGDMNTTEIRRFPEWALKVATALNVRLGFLPARRAPQISVAARRRHSSTWGVGRVAQLHHIHSPAVLDAVNRFKTALQPFKDNREALVAADLAVCEASAAREVDQGHDAHVTKVLQHVHTRAQIRLNRVQRAARPLEFLLPAYTRSLMTDADVSASQGTRSERHGAYTGTLHEWVPARQSELAAIQSSNVLRITRRFLQSGACVGIDGLAEILDFVEKMFQNEEVMQLEVLLHDAEGKFLATFFWHRDDGTPEAGLAESGRGAMCRTIILCLDAGAVGLHIAGFEPISYAELPSFPHVLLSMAPNVWHKSHVFEPGAPRAPGEPRVQRKLVVHMREREERPRVDWLSLRYTMAPAPPTGSKRSREADT